MSLRDISREIEQENWSSKEKSMLAMLENTQLNHSSIDA